MRGYDIFLLAIAQPLLICRIQVYKFRFQCVSIGLVICFVGWVGLHESLGNIINHFFSQWRIKPDMRISSSFSAFRHLLCSQSFSSCNYCRIFGINIFLNIITPSLQTTTIEHDQFTVFHFSHILSCWFIVMRLSSCWHDICYISPVTSDLG